LQGLSRFDKSTINSHYFLPENGAVENGLRGKQEISA
jgi:hypothetical protein